MKGPLLCWSELEHLPVLLSPAPVRGCLSGWAGNGDSEPQRNPEQMEDAVWAERRGPIGASQVLACWAARLPWQEPCCCS